MKTLKAQGSDISQAEELMTGVSDKNARAYLLAVRLLWIFGRCNVVFAGAGGEAITSMLITITSSIFFVTNSLHHNWRKPPAKENERLELSFQRS